MSSHLPRALATAYRNTDFVVRRPEKDIVLQVGSLNRGLNPLLKKHNCETWAFVTAWNPASRPLTRKANDTRDRRLRREIERLGYRCFRGHGQPRKRDWPAEESFLVLGIPASHARAIGDRYGQLAVVVGRPDMKARLLRCHPISTQRDDGALQKRQ